MIPPSPHCVTPQDIAEAALALDKIVHHTPVLTSRTLDQRCHCHVFCKAENLQRAGAFKIRGAYNAMRQLPSGVSGVVAGSSGNHAQGVALAAQLLGLKAIIVMPADASPVKVAATRNYGAEVVFFDRNDSEARDSVVNRLAEEKGYAIIPAHNHPHVIAGQGTLALEMLEQVPPLDIFMAPVSGGGLLTGCAVTLKHVRPHCRIIGVEPALADDFRLSLLHGHIRRADNVGKPATMADGLRCAQPGPYAFALAQQHVDDILTVDEKDIKEAMAFIWSRMKVVVEPSAAVCVAALLRGLVPHVQEKNVGIVFSGGNVTVPE